MRVPVIILNYNSATDCRRCVADLLRQTGVSLEIIIVDNCSRPDDRNAVKKLCMDSGLTFIPADTNRGYNAGNNIGLRYAASKGYTCALIANPDMQFPQADYVATLAANLAGHPDAAVIASDIRTPDGSPQNPMREMSFCEEFFWPFYLIADKIHHRPYVRPMASSGCCDKVSGCCMMVSIDFVQTIGFFDESVFLYCEEPILSKQVARVGRRMYYLAGTRAVHAHVASTKGNPAQRWKCFFASRDYYLRHYSGYGSLALRLLRLSRHLQQAFYNKLYQ